MNAQSKFKSDPDFAAAADHAYNVTASELRQFIERYEQLEVEKKTSPSSKKR